MKDDKIKVAKDRAAVVRNIVDGWGGYSKHKSKEKDKAINELGRIEKLIILYIESDSKIDFNSLIISIQKKLWVLEQLTNNLVEVDQLTTRLNEFRKCKNVSENPILLLAEDAIDSLRVIVGNYERQLLELRIDLKLGYVPLPEAKIALDERNEFAPIVIREQKRGEKAGNTTKDRHQKIPRELLRKIIPAYAEKNPRLLNDTFLARDVKSELRRQLITALKNVQHKVKGDPSLNIDVTAVLKELGYQSKCNYSKNSML